MEILSAEFTRYQSYIYIYLNIHIYYIYIPLRVGPKLVNYVLVVFVASKCEPFQAS